MKRFIALLLLALTLTFSFASCNEPEQPDDEWEYTTTISNYTKPTRHIFRLRR